ncbi:LysM peptidoglycan-binding domain-containing protein [Candidatus Blastococcus massiliensis]|uniref:LysM peptidoglycan-binding domain-containing protein n=1 Tax=Candidatus Blastococcus massiliensis TaxID=1470358 RepID=UPI0004AECAE9|nr:hypothetical protein [Candidatus Blastococcus massiliensis]
MTGRRLVGTAATTGSVGLALSLLTPSFPEMTGTVLAAQRMTDAAGAETLVLAAVGLLAWTVWAWGALGLLLTAASALPGALGAAADVLTRGVLPAGARRGAALALGLGLGVAAPMAGTTLLIATAPAAAAGAAPLAVPEWPTAPGTDVGALPEWPAGEDAGEATPSSGGARVPDWPAVPGVDSPPSDGPTVPSGPDAPAPGAHVVLRGDCLWDIAAAELTARLGRTPTDGETARATHAWWLTNAAVIGSDPDLLLPGQVLRPPP